MKIILIHGEDSPAIINKLDDYLAKAKSKNWLIEKFNLSAGLTMAEFLSVGSLFTEKRLFLIEDVRELTPTDLLWLKKNNDNLKGYLILVNDGVIGTKIIQQLPSGIKIEEQKLPRLIFTFLDAFYPKNTAQLAKILKQLEKHEPLEFILALLARHLRDLYWVKEAAQPLPYAEHWRIEKLNRQARLFKAGQLESLIATLADADITAKTSQASLEDLLDQIVSTQLE